MDIRYDDDESSSNIKTKKRKVHESEIEGLLIVKFPFQPYDVQKTFLTLVFTQIQKF